MQHNFANLFVFHFSDFCYGIKLHTTAAAAATTTTTTTTTTIDVLIVDTLSYSVLENFT